MSQPTRLRAVCLVRVSSQVQRERHTIASQLTVLPEFIARRGWELVRPVDYYMEDGQSAATGRLEQRDVIRRLLADAEAGQFDVIAAIDDDRITRTGDLLERLAVYGRLKSAGVLFAAAATDQVLDLAQGMDQLLITVKSWASAEDNRKRRESSMRGSVEAIRRGRKPRGPTPYGYTYDKSKPPGQEWGLDEAEAKTVRVIFQRVLAGISLYRIAMELEAEGAPRPRGGRWYRDRVHQIVTNGAYSGRYVADKARGLTIATPRIVSDDVFAAAQASLVGRRVGGPVMPRVTREPALCEGIGRCGLCGGRMRIQWNQKGRRAYACATKCFSTEEMKFHGLARRCPNPTRTVSDVDALVWADLLQVLRDPATFEKGLAYHEREIAKDQNLEVEIREYEERLARLTRAEGEVLMRFQRGKISAPAMDRALEQGRRDRELLARNRDILRAELAAAARSRAETRALVDAAGELAHRLEDAALTERRDLLRLLVPGRDGYYVTFMPDKVQIVGRLEKPAAPLALVGPEVLRNAIAGSSGGRSQDPVPFMREIAQATRKPPKGIASRPAQTRGGQRR